MRKTQNANAMLVSLSFIAVALYVLSLFDKYAEKYRPLNTVAYNNEYPIQTFFGACPHHISNRHITLQIPLVFASMLPMLMIVFGGLFVPLLLSQHSQIIEIFFLTYAINLFVSNVKKIIVYMFPESDGYTFWKRPCDAMDNASGLPSGHAAIAGCWTAFMNIYFHSHSQSHPVFYYFYYFYYIIVILIILLPISRWVMRYHTCAQLLLGYSLGYTLTMIFAPHLHLQMHLHLLSNCVIAVGMFLHVLDEWLKVRFLEEVMGKYYAYLPYIIHTLTFAPFIMSFVV